MSLTGSISSVFFTSSSLINLLGDPSSSLNRARAVLVGGISLLGAMQSKLFIGVSGC